jgi:hypothetical protein
MRKDTAINYYGSAAKLASALGISTQAVYKWGDVVPQASAIALYVASGNAIELGPEDYPNSRFMGSQTRISSRLQTGG